MKVLVAQLGARRHYAVPRGLAMQSMLGELVTDLCADAPPLSWLRRSAPASLLPKQMQRLLERRVDGVPGSRIRNLAYFAADPRHHRRKNESQTDHWARRNAAFCRAVAGRGFDQADAVYAFNGAALEIFEPAEKRGLRCILDQTAAPWRYNTALLKAEADRWPGWEAQPTEVDESGELSEREEREWRLADVIVCGSSFAADALASIGGPAKKCVVAYYGGHLNVPVQQAAPRSFDVTGRKLRVLAIGSLQLRKGPQYLLEAARQLSDRMDFRWIGKNLLSEQATANLGEHVELTGHVARSAVWEHLAWADLFVLPTLSEGSANAVYEAMAAGLPVITTPNSGSLIEDGITGVLVEPGNGAALLEAIRQLGADSLRRRRLAEAGRAAMQRQSLAIYGEMLGRTLGCRGADGTHIAASAAAISERLALVARPA